MSRPAPARRVVAHRAIYHSQSCACPACAGPRRRRPLARPPLVDRGDRRAIAAGGLLGVVAAGAIWFGQNAAELIAWVRW